MKKWILEIIQTKTIKHTFVTTLGVFINGALGLVFYIYMARFLGPAEFGIFSISVLFLTLLSDVVDLGTSTGLVRFVGEHINSNKPKALKYLKLTLEAKAVISILIIILGWFLVPVICTLLLNKPDLIPFFRLSLIGVGTSLLFSFSTYAIQAVQKFTTWSVLNIGMNSLRMILIFVLFFLGTLNINSGLIIYTLVPFVGFMLGLLFIPNFWNVKNEIEVKKELFHFNKWIAVFSFISAFSSRLDSFIVARFLILKDIGVYSVATNLSSVVPQIVFALGAVVAPKLASFDSKEKALNYLKKLQLFTLFLSILGVSVGIPLAYYVIPNLYGVGYINAIYPLIVLIIAQAIFLLSVPVHTGVIYFFSYPKLFVLVSTINLFVTLILGWLLISNFGYLGASFVVLIGNIFNFIIPAYWIVNKFKTK
ncbi:oligosaccharide flippase family protein [Candidatus Woesebacteria bacterium]|nr:oligosaccharide flippase family protein [Candidatus Woesebacteria bacterium]